MVISTGDKDMAHNGKPGAARVLYQQLARTDLSDSRRASLLDVRQHRHVFYARARGLNEKRVWRDHILRNAWMPLVTATGSLSALYTVLAEGDDHQDPIVDCARAILDGHIVLSRKLADVGHYPAIDVAASVSRCMSQITDRKHLNAARQFKEYASLYDGIKELIPLGGYTPGMDPGTDRAVKLAPNIERFLRQDVGASAELNACIETLQSIVR